MAETLWNYMRRADRGGSGEFLRSARQGAQTAQDLRRDYETAVPSSTRSEVEPAADSTASQTLHATALDRQPGLLTGKIVYHLPYVHWYRVQLDNMGGDMPCCRVTETPHQPFGIRDTGPLPAGTDVLIWLGSETHYGLILGAIPSKVEDGGLVAPDWIFQGSGGGFKKDAYYQELLQLCVDGAGVTDFSNNRPLDSLSTDWGRISDLGGGIHIDPFMIWLRQDETCGLYLYYMDKLCRLAGYNFDLRTAISELMVRNDRGEGLHVEGFTPYPWEALGLKEPGEAYRDISDTAVQYTAKYGRIEPLIESQRPFFRYEEYRGYLGQACMRQVQLPPKAGPQTYRYAAEPPYAPGVFREQIGLDGSYMLSSAHSLALEKRIFIPIPSRKRPVEDDVAGDNPDNYRYAGRFGDGDPHRIGDVNITGELKGEQEAAAASDIGSHAQIWKGLHPFQYHENDYQVPQPADHEPVQEPLNFTALLSNAFLPDAQGIPQQVDHRYGEVAYYQRRAGIYFLPRGGVVIRDGSGCEIKMSGGRITASAPGDVWLQPGRNLNVYAGDDIILRAKNSIDITATDKDVRVKAENNLEMLAANSGNGRMLLENRATAAFHPDEVKTGEEIQGTGIIFRAKQSQIITMAKDIFLRTGGSPSDQTVAPGNIYIDAARGQRDIICTARFFTRELDQGAIDQFPVSGDKQTVNFFSQYNTQLMTALQLKGGLIITEAENGSNGILVEGQINVVNGHVATTQSAFSTAEADFGRLGALEKQSLADSQQTLETVRNFMQTSVENETEASQFRVDNLYTELNQPGSDAFQKATEFGLRNASQMNTENFKLIENYWQQLCRAAGEPPGTWTEKVIEYQSQQMMPHPGREAWQQQQTWQTMTPAFNQFDTGKEQNRVRDIYEEGTIEPFVALTPDGAYPIISN